MRMGHTIEYVLFPGALGLDITGPLEVFNTASEITRSKKHKAYSARFVAAEKGPVRLSSGLEIVANASFKEMSKKAAPQADTLLVPGGSDIDSVISDPDFMDYIRRRSTLAGRIISVCRGTFILAAAGLLDGKKATTHWLDADELGKRFPEVIVKSDAIFINDDNIYTSAGVSTGIDLALAIVEEDLGVVVGVEVSRLLVVYFRRPGAQSQFSQPLKSQEVAGERFSSLYNWLAGNLDHAISVEQMAEFSGMSQRNFARVFKSKTGMTPNKYLETLRLDKAREIMISGNEGLDTIARASGFGREERLRRAFLRRFGVTPSQYRMHFVH